jgi:hypothetical protein
MDWEWLPGVCAERIFFVKKGMRVCLFCVPGLREGAWRHACQYTLSLILVWVHDFINLFISHSWGHYEVTKTQR